MRALLPVGLLGLVLFACSSSDSNAPEAAAPEQALLPGFAPPAPKSGELRVYAPLVKNIQPGADITWCDYIANPFNREVDVVQSRGYQSKSGHHAILMEVPGAEERLGISRECLDADMTNARFLAGGSDGIGEFKIPEGIGFRIKQGSVLMVQTHWINASNKALDGQTVFNVQALPPDPKRQPAQLFAATTTSVDLPAHGPAHASTSCTIQSDLQFFTIGGHAHEWGKNVRLTIERKGATETLYDQPWEPHFQSDPPLKYFEAKAPLVLHAGDVLHVDCDFSNDTDAEIHFPREMCVGLGFYFPGTSDIHCVNGQWSQ